MKKIATILTLLTVSLTFTFGQTVTDSISMKKVFGGYQFSQGEKRLNMNQLVNAIETVEPYAVDVCSGVRSNGFLDIEKLDKFFTAVLK